MSNYIATVLPASWCIDINVHHHQLPYDTLLPKCCELNINTYTLQAEILIWMKGWCWSDGTRKGCNKGHKETKGCDVPSFSWVHQPTNPLHDKWVLCLVTKFTSRPVQEEEASHWFTAPCLWFAINCDCEMKRQCRAQFWHCVHLQRGAAGGMARGPQLCDFAVKHRRAEAELWLSLMLRLVVCHSIGHCSSFYRMCTQPLWGVSVMLGKNVGKMKVAHEGRTTLELKIRSNGTDCFATKKLKPNRV